MSGFFSDKATRNEVYRVAVFRALNLGDMLCSVPALRALRAGFPMATIALIGLPWAREFAQRFHQYVDEFIEFPGYPGLPEREPDTKRIPSFLESLQRQRFDLGLQMHGSGLYVNSLVALFGARCTGGFYSPPLFAPHPETFVPYPESGHEIDRLLTLVESIGVPLCGRELEFPLFEDEQTNFRRQILHRGLRIKDYVCIHAGCRGADRRWSAELFARVADRIASMGLQVVLTGSVADIPLNNAVRHHMQKPALDLAGATTLGTLGCLLGGSKVVICNDTGVSHVSAALRVPSVVIFTGSDPSRWAPVNSELHRPVVVSDSVGVDHVVHHAAELLGQEIPYAA